MITHIQCIYEMECHIVCTVSTSVLKKHHSGALGPILQCPALGLRSSSQSLLPATADLEWYHSCFNVTGFLSRMWKIWIQFLPLHAISDIDSAMVECAERIGSLEYGCSCMLPQHKTAEMEALPLP